MRFVAAALATGLLLAFGTASLRAYPLTLEQRQRFQRFLPRTFPKLEGRDPVHVVLLGDSVAGGYTPLESAWEPDNPLFTFAGKFLSELAKEFFYPGGVHLLNPPEGGTTKLSEYLGDEITLENLCEIDGTMLTGLRRVGTDAFLHRPDLVIVQYGIYDSFARISTDAYRLALQEIIDAARRESIDVIVFSPTLAQFGGGAMEWGITRPYAMAAREVTAANGVLFIDAGQHLARFGGGVDPDTEPAAVMQVVEDKLARMFHFGPELKDRERVHLSPRAHDYLGEVAFDDLKNGPGNPRFTYAGIAGFQGDGTVQVTMAIRNQTKEVREGTVGALSIGEGLVPVDPSKRFTVAPNAVTQLAFSYRRPIVGKARDGSDVLFPVGPSDEFGRFSFVVEDTVASELADLPLRLGPITALWKSRQFVNVTDRVRVEWDLVNGSDKAVSGTFQVGMGDKVGEPTNFSVSPLGTKTVFSLFEFSPPGGADQFQRDIWIQTDVDGVVTRFNRELEGTRDLVLGEEMEMRTWEGYANASPAGAVAARMRSDKNISLRFDADDSALYVVATMDGVRIPDMGDRAALRARLFLDARPLNEVLTFGAVHPVEVYTKGADGSGFTPELALGSFGNGYNMILSPKGIASVLRTSETGQRVLEIRVPRSYLHRHEWALDSLESLLGVRLEITVADPDESAVDPFPLENTWITNSPTWAFENNAIHGFFEEDARSLTTLRLGRQPVKSWSVRLY